MKRFILIAITCIVVDQLKSQTGWLTKCKGFEVDGEIVLEKKIERGQAVLYKPYIVEGDEYVHGRIMSIVEPPPPSRDQESSDAGKSAQ